MFTLRKTSRLYPTSIRIAKMSDTQLGDLGCGAGRGGGGGGSIRAAGGGFGRREAAQEEGYFYKKQQELLDNLKRGHIDQVAFHKKQISKLEHAIENHKEYLFQFGKK